MVFGMSTTIPMDKAGRIVLPKPIRDRMRLRPGSTFAVEVHADHLRLRPLERDAPLVKDGGWWVHRGSTTDAEALTSVVERHRGERLEDLAR